MPIVTIRYFFYDANKNSHFITPSSITSSLKVAMSILSTPDILGISPLRILLVEDSTLIRDAIVESLSWHSGIRFDGFATTQDEAIALLFERQFDLLLVDIELAKGNGFEVLKALDSERFSYPRPICIMLTNHAFGYYRNQAKMLGVEFFFDKSMDFDLAIETVEAAAAKHALP